MSTRNSYLEYQLVERTLVYSLFTDICEALLELGHNVYKAQFFRLKLFLTKIDFSGDLGEAMTIRILLHEIT